MGKLLKKLAKDEAGQSTTEYILILAVVVMVAMKFKDKFGGLLGGAVDTLGNKVNQAINTDIQ